MENDILDLTDLKESKEFLNILINNISSAVFIADKSMKILSFNDTFTKLLHKDPEEIIGNLCGNSLGCSFAVEEGKDCGSTSHCNQCALRQKSNFTFNTKIPTINNVLKRDFYIDNKKVSKYYQYNIQSVRFNENDYIVLIFDDITEHENQKITLRRQNEKITESLDYARLIQDAIIPPEDLLKIYFAEYFIFFKPRDIVSGDFYWIKHICNKHIIAVADCTGHGVPGALISMLGITLLNNIITGEENLGADTILNLLRANIIRHLRQSGEDGGNKDGMDISLIILDLETNTLEFAAAYSPIYLVHNNELQVLKADNMPVGVYHRPQPFSSGTYPISKGDSLYLFSDGYEDQFGGPQGRKFYSRQFRQLLQEINKKPMPEQKILLDKTIEDWQNGYDAKFEQTDDITVMGIRI